MHSCQILNSVAMIDKWKFFTTFFTKLLTHIEGKYAKPRKSVHIQHLLKSKKQILGNSKQIENTKILFQNRITFK